MNIPWFKGFHFERLRVANTRSCGAARRVGCSHRDERNSTAIVEEHARNKRRRFTTREIYTFPACLPYREFRRRRMREGCGRLVRRRGCKLALLCDVARKGFNPPILPGEFRQTTLLRKLFTDTVSGYTTSFFLFLLFVLSFLTFTSWWLFVILIRVFKNVTSLCIGLSDSDIWNERNQEYGYNFFVCLLDPCIEVVIEGLWNLHNYERCEHWAFFDLFRTRNVIIMSLL